jgi:hypothetical protein
MHALIIKKKEAYRSLYMRHIHPYTLPITQKVSFPKPQAGPIPLTVQNSDQGWK